LAAGARVSFAFAILRHNGVDLGKNELASEISSVAE
jgi:hypothetical protein